MSLLFICFLIRREEVAGQKTTMKNHPREKQTDLLFFCKPGLGCIYIYILFCTSLSEWELPQLSDKAHFLRFMKKKRQTERFLFFSFFGEKNNRG